MVSPHRLARIQRFDATSKPADMALSPVSQNYIAGREAPSSDILPTQPNLLLPPVRAPSFHRIARPLAERSHLQPSFRHNHNHRTPTTIATREAPRNRRPAESIGTIRCAFQSRTINPRSHVAALIALRHSFPPHRPRGSPPKVHHNLRKGRITKGQPLDAPPHPRLPQRRNPFFKRLTGSTQHFTQRRAWQQGTRPQGLPRKVRQRPLHLDVGSKPRDGYVLAQHGRDATDERRGGLAGLFVQDR
jgi:hypothetical protein